MISKLAAFPVSPAGSVSGLQGANQAGGTRATGQDFASLVAKFTNESLAVGHASEKQAFQAVAKQADIVDVVAAVSNAEVTLDTVMTIRDRVIQAYQEIIKMPV
jgi:flagellar hook-basal body complex protein FliE